MRFHLILVLGIAACALFASAQTAEELVAKNLKAKGGLDKIKAIKTLRTQGKFQQSVFTAQTGDSAKAPDKLRETFTIQGMTAIQAYDGTTGWQVSPFQGRKDPELLGEDDLRDIVEDADFYGPLVDYQEKGNKIEYLGHDTIDGDDVYRLKVTLKNGDLVYYYLDPETYLEIRTEKQQFIRGAVKETVTDLGSYKQVDGVYYPFSIESGPKNNPNARSKVTISSIQANLPIDDSVFKIPASPAVPSEQKHQEPPSAKPKPSKPGNTKPPAA